MSKNTTFKQYTNLKELMIDPNLDIIDIEMLTQQLYLFDELWFDKNTNVILIDTKILSYRGDTDFKGRIYKIRIKNEAISAT